MDQNRPAFFRRPAFGLALLGAIALVVGFLALPTDAPSEPAAQPGPSYASLQDVLRDGQGKGLDRGSFEVWASISPSPTIPTAWVWVVDDTADGSGVEYWAYHPDYVHPGADEDAMLTFSHHDVDHDTVEDFVDWIVANNSHTTASKLTLVKNVVSVVE